MHITLRRERKNKMQKLKDRNSIEGFFRKTAILWILIVLCIILSFLTPAFASTSNMMLIVKQSAITGMLAIGMTMVILTGEIDLSVGAIIALSSVCSAMYGGLAAQGMPIIVPIIVGILVGLICGLVNGFMVAYVGFPSFIMTLAMMMIARGVARVLCNGSPVFGISDPFMKLANTFVFGIPSLVVFFILVLIICYIFLNKTVTGSRIYAVGGNENAARLSGVNTKRIKLLVFVIAGALAGLCGVLMTSRISSGSSIVADGYELDAIAATVIGGTSMTGGIGSIWGTVVGALLIATMQNGLDMMGVNEFYKVIVQGLIIVAAVLFDIRSKAKRGL